MLLRSQAITSLAPIMEHCPLSWNTVYIGPTLPPLHVRVVVPSTNGLPGVQGEQPRLNSIRSCCQLLFLNGLGVSRTGQACREHARQIRLALGPLLLDQLGVALPGADLNSMRGGRAPD